MKPNNTLQERLQQSFRIHAKRMAILFGDQSISYDELYQSATRVANYLHNRQVPALSFVGISVSNRRDFIIAMLGIIMNRCVFVPLDMKLPAARLQAMQEKLELEHIIADDIISNEQTNQSADFSGYQPNDPLYVYFTSGSTGEPKAVVGKNESLLHFINWEIETFHIDHTCRVSQFINPGFDACLRDIFVPLLSGGTICIMPQIDSNVYETDLTKWINETGINLIHCVPSFFKLINHDAITCSDYPSLKYVLLSGEQLQIPQLKKWYDRMGSSVQLVNLYGTTETTLVKTFYRVQPEDVYRDLIPAGHPIADTEILILDEGDVYISTPYMTLGYYNDKEANDKKFIRHGDKVLYQTGDTGKWLSDGSLVILGRKDRQVKIRGIRIEPGEIEKAVLQHPAIKEAVVAVKEDNNKEPVLVVYYTGSAQDKETLYEFANLRLPVYMAPRYFAYLEKIPLTTNGKTDINALPDPFVTTNRVVTSPRNKREEEITELWSQLLNISKDNIGTTDNFFFLGGNSIQVLQLLSKILERFNYRMSLESFLKQPTIAACSIQVNQQQSSKDDLVQASPKPVYALTYGQQRIFRDCFGKTDSTSFNLPNVIEVAGHIEPEFLKSVLLKLINRHEILRTSFVEAGQVINKEVDFQLRYILTTEENLHADIASSIQPFDLTKAPLIRVSLLELNETKQVLIVDIHHIIMDALSGRVLERELISLLQGEELSPVSLHYKDFAEWQQSEPQKLIRIEQEKYWMNRFSDPAPLLTLSHDHDRPATKNYNGAIYKFYYDKEQVNVLNAYAQRKAVTVFTVLLASYYVLLNKLSDTEDIVIGIPTSGRSHPATAEMIGLFVGELALRNHISPSNSFHSFLLQLNDDIIDAFKNQDFNYKNLKEKMQPHVSEGRNALFDVWFAFQKLLQPTVKVTDSITFIKHINNNTTALFDLVLRVYETDDGMEFRLEYATSLFNQDTIENFANYYKNILQQVIHDDRVPVASIEIRQLVETI